MVVVVTVRIRWHDAREASRKGLGAVGVGSLYSFGVVSGSAVCQLDAASVECAVCS